MSERIIAHALDRRWNIASPVDASRRGGSVMLNLPAEAADVVAALRSRQLYCDARGNTLRLSPGAVTTTSDVDATTSDVDALCTALDDLLARR